MCGIFTILNNKDNYKSHTITNAFNKGVNRGPEYSELCTFDKTTSIGFHRLAINGLDNDSTQPIKLNNIILVCNGEIYNYKDLFSQINKIPKTNSDCEIIIHLYELYGIEYTLNLLDGVFALVLYDINNQRLFVARDPYGVRPLYIMAPDCNEIPCVILNTNYPIGIASE